MIDRMPNTHRFDFAKYKQKLIHHNYLINPLNSIIEAIEMELLTL